MDRLTRGDDLDDDFIPDDLVALSDGEQLDDAASISLDEDPVDPTHPSSSAPTPGTLNPAGGDEAAKAAKKRKRREKEKQKKVKKQKLLESSENPQLDSLAVRPPDFIAEYLSNLQAKSFPKSSPMELDTYRIPSSSIADTSLWSAPRPLDQLGDFIAKTLPVLHTRLSQRSKSAGAPTLLFIAGAALRVVDVTRVLKDKKIRGEKGSEVAKLFARHFKLEEHVTYLKRTKVGAAVGTPGRIGKLLCETDALSLSALTHVVLDVTYRDAKKRGLLDIPETRDEVFQTVLGAPKLLELIRQGKVQVVLF